MNRQEKQQVVDSLKLAFSKASLVVLAEKTGLVAKQTLAVRRKVKASEGLTLVAKNTLMKLAMSGTDYESLSDLCKGSSILFYTENDPIALAKTLVDFAKDNPSLALRGAGLGQIYLDNAALKNLAAIPPLEVLRSQLIGIIQAPATKIARLLKEPGAQLARLLKAKSEG